MYKTVLNILKFAIPVVIVAGLAIAIAMLVKSNREIRRLKDNFDTEISGRKDVQQTITPNELKKYFQEELDKLKEYGIKAKNVENIINVSYLYRDTLLYKDTLVYVYDTITEARYAPFSFDSKCWSISGFVKEDTVGVDNVVFNDDILISLYKEKRKCLFERRKVKAIAISDCTGDTLRILRNLKIEK